MSIIEEIVDDEEKKKRKALKKKRELERLRKENERLRLEKERLAEEKKKKKRFKMKLKKKDVVPPYKRKIEHMISEQSASTGHDSLPVHLISQQTTTGTTAKQQINVQTPPGPGAQGPQQGTTVHMQVQQVMQVPQMQQAPDPLAQIKQLVSEGTKDEISSYFSKALRSRSVIYLPGINSGNFKFPDYGYKRFLEHIIESKDFLQILVDVDDVQGVKLVSLSNYIHPKDDPADADDKKVIPAEITIRGLEGLCEILFNKSAEFDMYENEWKHLNTLLGCFAQPDIKGRLRTWNIETEKSKLKLTANNQGDTWMYKADVQQK